jgi:arginyl-tRNA synthetase
MKANVGESNPKFGDYQCNSALGISKKYKNQHGVSGNPKEVGEKLMQCLPPCDMLAEIT